MIDPPDASRRLRAAGLRSTAARVAVLSALESARRPLTHAALQAWPGVEGLDSVTVYRTLATLEEAGLTHRVPGTDGVWRTCPQPEGQPGCPGNHAHFLCFQCGSMRCLDDQPIPRVSVPDGARVLGRHLVAFGACERCASDPVMEAP